MTLLPPDRKPLFLALTLALAAGLPLGPSAHATLESDAATYALDSEETLANLGGSLDADQAPAAHAESRPPVLAPIRWDRDAGGTRVILENQPIFRFKGDDGALAQRVTLRLSGLKRQGVLRSDRITPASHGGRYYVNVGNTSLIEIDDSFAKKQGSRAGALTLSYVNALRNHLGGVPIQIQVSRGLLPGARSGVGLASWYGGLFHGRRAASGERFDMHAHTAAHKTLPFGTLLLVTNLSNSKTTLVRITDRGPYSHGRSLDLSRAAAGALGMLGSGVARVRYTVLSRS